MKPLIKVQAWFESRLSSTQNCAGLAAAGGNGFGRRAARILKLLGARLSSELCPRTSSLIGRNNIPYFRANLIASYAV